MKITNKKQIKLKLESHRLINSITKCWRWGLSLNGEYGRIKIDNKFYPVHRVSLYIYKKFDLNSPLRGLHKIECPFKYCFNPDHLYAGDYSDNSYDTVKAGHNHEANKTHCSKGHRYTPKNTYTNPNNNKRVCRTCHRKAALFAYHKNKIIQHQS